MGAVAQLEPQVFGGCAVGFEVRRAWFVVVRPMAYGLGPTNHEPHPNDRFFLKKAFIKSAQAGSNTPPVTCVLGYSSMLPTRR